MQKNIKNYYIMYSNKISIY